MEDLFAQKDVGLFNTQCVSVSLGSVRLIEVFLCLCVDGGGGAAELDREASGSTAGLRSGFSSAGSGGSGVAGDEETESV